MRSDADIFDRVFEYGMQRARLEAIRDKLREEIRELKSINGRLDAEMEDTSSALRLLQAENKELKSSLKKALGALKMISNGGATFVRKYAFNVLTNMKKEVKDLKT